MTTFLEFARRGRTQWWCYVLAPILAMVIWVGLIVVAFVPAFIGHLIPADFDTLARDPSHPVFFYGFTGLIFGGLVLAFTGAVRIVHGKRFMDIVGAWSWRRMGFAAGLWLVVCIVCALVDYVVSPSGFHLTFGPQTATLAMIAIPSLAVQTFCEEFIFRGYVTQGLLLATKRPLVTAVISGLIFGAMHIPNGAPEAANAVLFGIVTALIAIRTGGLAFTYGLHLVNNLFGAIIVVSAGDVLHGSPGVITQVTPNLMWLDVGAACVAFALVWWLVASRPAAVAVGPEEVF